MSQRSLSYQYEEIAKYQALNNSLPQSLVSLCMQDVYNRLPDLSGFNDQLRDIVCSITKGDDPNNIVFRNFVKFYVNKIHQGTYKEYLEKLKTLDYSSKDNVHFLGSELIVCSIRCPISVKGFTFQEDSKYKSVPEICADIAKQFSTFAIMDTSGNVKDINFREELLKLCRQFFLDFVDLKKSLDENNENTSDNYKGFMTFMGLLYSRKIVDMRVIIDCVDIIKRSIFNSECQSEYHLTASDNEMKHTCDETNDKLFGFKKQLDGKLCKNICYFDCNKCGAVSETNILVTHRKQIECINLYKGYEHLLTHVIHSLNQRIDDLVGTLTENKKRMAKLKCVSDNILTENINIDVVSYIKNKKQSDFIKSSNDENTVVLEEENLNSFDDFVKLFDNKKSALMSLKHVVENECSAAISQQTSILSTIEKMRVCLEIMIGSHQEMGMLNQYYKSLHKGQLVLPFKPYIIITHNSLGSSLNKLCEKMETFGAKCTTKYKPIGSSTSISEKMT
jgi:hypothetical protein